MVKKSLDTVGGRKFVVAMVGIVIALSLIVAGWVSGPVGLKGIVTITIAYVTGNVANKFVGRFANGNYETDNDNPRISE